MVGRARTVELFARYGMPFHRPRFDLLDLTRWMVIGSIKEWGATYSSPRYGHSATMRRVNSMKMLASSLIVSRSVKHMFSGLLARLDPTVDAR